MAAIDGTAVPDIAPYYEKSTLFSVTLGPDNIFGLPAGFVLDPCADAGYYLMVKPLSPGQHTIHFTGTMNNGLSVDVTYHLTVAGR